ncbi:MAG: protein kinase domain-containing protein [Gemmatimonadaceae bacterium]
MEDPAVQLADALRDRYTIERELGRGGMATVYLARDVKHGRSVALKVLHPELAASLSCERFRREVLFAARLQHPHILTVLDSGETAGRLWFTMSFVEGESLRDRVKRERQLPVADALLITHQVASALDFAHRHGIIHRDIKPENILLIGDDALVADFGIARALAEGAGTITTTTITSPGSAVGTAAYMSPEQASAETFLDGRTDVYALACVLFEMLAGETPFTGPTIQAVIAKRFLGDVPSVRKLRPAVSEGIDAAIMRALAPVRADRFRTPCDFYDALAAAYKGTTEPVRQSPNGTSTGSGSEGTGQVASRPNISSGPNSAIITSVAAGTDTGSHNATGSDKPAESPPLPAATAVGVPLDVSAVGSSGVSSAPAAHAAARSRPSRRWTRQSRVATAAAVTGVVVLLAAGWSRILRLARADILPASAVASDPRRIAVLPFDNVGDSSDAYFAQGVSDALRGKLTSLPGLQVTARTSSVQYRGTAKTPAQIGKELGVDYLAMGTVRWERGGDGTESRVQVSPELVQVSSNAAKWQQPFDAPVADVFKMQGDIAGQLAQALNVSLDARDVAKLAQRPTTSLTAYDAYLKGQEASDGLGVSDPLTLKRAIAFYEDAVSLDPNFGLAWSQLSRAQSIVYLNSTHTAAQARLARIAAERALALSPNGAVGHLALGNYYLALGENALALGEFQFGSRAAPLNVELLSQTGRAEFSLGRYDSALGHLQQARAVDPRAVATARGLARLLLWMRRYPAALEVNNSGLALAPGNIALLENKVMICLARGDLAGARAVINLAPESLDRAELGAWMYDLVWVLDPQQQKAVLTLSPAAYDNDVGKWALTVAQIYTLHGETGRATAYADSAAVAYATQLRSAPDDAQRHALRGVALGLAGHSAEAIREAQATTALLPPSRDAYVGAYTQHQVVRTYILAGQPEKALDMLQPLLRMPYFVSPAWLRIDPNFAPLRRNPRFRKLLARS